MPSPIRSLSLVVTLMLSGAVLAPLSGADTLTPVAGSATIKEVSGVVEVINTQTRMMTLKTPEGTFEVFHVPVEVKRIDAIKVGDKVSFTETEAVLVDIEKGRDAGSMAAIPEKTVTPEPGKKPAGTIVDKLTLYGKVIAVDKVKSTVTVQGPQQTLTLKVEDPAIFAEMSPGDGVIATYVRSISGKVVGK